MSSRLASAECISIVVPVFNEDENIGPCLRGLWDVLAEAPHEILVCYDFDEDTTLAAIAAMPDAPPSVRLVKNELGRGAAFALRAGFQAARGDVVITSMADLSDPPDSIPAMAALIRSEGAAVVSASRYMKGGSLTGGPLVKRTLSRWACLSLNWLADVGTHDATNNFRAYDPRFLGSVEIESDQAFDIALELTVKAYLQGERIAEVPSSWVDRSAGESRFQVWKWAPAYLRWWLAAAGPPLAVLISTAVLFAITLAAFRAGGERPLVVDLVWSGGLAAIALAWTRLARGLRGRGRYLDVAHVLLWLHPGLAWALAGEVPRGEVLVAAAVASALLVTVDPGWRAVRCAPSRAAPRSRE